MAAPLLSGVAFITGGASGIGKATAYALVRNGVTKLAIADLNFEGAKTVAAEITIHFTSTTSLTSPEPPITVLPLPLDVTSEPSIDAAVHATITAFHRLDYAINCAGMVTAFQDSHTQPTADFDHQLSVNLRGVWLSSRAEIRHMITQQPTVPNSPRHNRGVIVNVASILGLVGTPNAIAYTASKHGVVGFTRGDGIVYARHNVRINAICPGYIETRLALDALDEEKLAMLRAGIPAGRLGSADEVADCVVFLCSPLSSYMYGAAMVADGGFTAQ